MRIDQFLKKTRIIKQRDAAKKACDRGQIQIMSQPVKPSREVQVGDLVTLNLANRTVEIEVLEIPDGNVSKARSATLYRLIRSEDTTEELFDV
jgi:ribosomal 50S subunit-recycling heat shock protein